MTIAHEDRNTETSVEPHAGAPARRPASRGASGRRLQSSLTVLAFAVVFVGYAVWLGGDFVDVGARLLNVHQNVPVLLLALGAVVTLVTGKFDLSIASMASLSAFLVVGLPTQQGLQLWAAIPVCLGVGALGGLINGILVTKLRINAFIATLGTGGVMLGLSSVYSGGGAVIPSRGSYALPTWFTTMGSYASHPPVVVTWVVAALLGTSVAVFALGGRPERLGTRAWQAVSWAAGAVVTIGAAVLLGTAGGGGGMSWLVVIMVVVALAVWTMLERTTVGRALKATGANPEAARLAGIDIDRHVVLAFVLSGVLASSAGIVLGATQGTVSPNMAGTFLLPAFAAAFLSTVVFSAGPFTVWGTVAGGVFVVWVGQGLILGGLPPTWTDVVNGSVLLVAVALSTVIRTGRR